MTTQTEALKLALKNAEAIVSSNLPQDCPDCEATMVWVHSMAQSIVQSIKEALAQQCVCGEPNSAGTHRTDGPCLAPQPEQEPVAHCEAGPEYCWKCNEEIKPTYGSEEIRKLREVNKHLADHIADANKMVEPPPWWPAIENILNEYGLQAIDFVADFKAALAQPEHSAPHGEPVAWMEGESVYWHTNPSLNDWIRANGTPLYTTPPQRTWVGLTDEDVVSLCREFMGQFDKREFIKATEFKLKEKNT